MTKTKTFLVAFIFSMNFLILEAIHPFMVFTHQKSGSWLLFECIKQISGYNHQHLAFFEYPVRQLAPVVESPDEFYRHFIDFFNNKKHFGFSHFERKDFAHIQNAIDKLGFSKVIITIRDPRDIAVSSLYYHILQDKLFQWEDRPSGIEKKLKQMNRDEQLEFVITDLINRYHSLEYMRKFFQRSGVLIVRYEDLIGLEGGGSRNKQEAAIRAVANYINAPLTEEKINKIADNLFGLKNSSKKNTFRKGTTSQWKNYFTPQHKEIFKVKYGQMLIDLGYEKDNNW